MTTQEYDAKAWEIHERVVRENADELYYAVMGCANAQYDFDDEKPLGWHKRFLKRFNAMIGVQMKIEHLAERAVVAALGERPESPALPKPEPLPPVPDGVCEFCRGSGEFVGLFPVYAPDHAGEEKPVVRGTCPKCNGSGKAE